ncbi:hypothetical protein [Kitasatospora sp. NPDC054795]
MLDAAGDLDQDTAPSLIAVLDSALDTTRDQSGKDAASGAVAADVDGSAALSRVGA